MKIECDKCAAKYSIADEKVRGKTFKIRCKKCSNVIIVRDKGAAADAGDDPEDDQGAPGWHLAINGETVGPLAEDDVRARYDAGEIDKDTAVWQEGFEDWVPLGDVPVFADLPDAPMGGGYDDGYGQDDEDDPFANANQEDYAAGAAAAASAAVAAAAPADPAPASPRVSALTGQRNENSVLFSLDSLQSLATSNQSAPAATKSSAGANQQVGTKGLATAAPGSEGSGLIDIRALGSMVGSDQPAAAAAAPPAADDAALPSFGGSGLGGLAAAPLVASVPEPAAAAAAAAPPPPQRSNAPIYILMVLLILALGGLAAYILLKPEQQPQVIVKEVPGAAPSVADKEDEDDDEKEEEEDEKKDEEEGDEEDEAGDEEGDSEGAEEEDEKSGSKRSSRRSSRKSSKKSSSSSKGDNPLAGFDDPKPKSSAKKPTSSKKKSDVSVDCILDPSKCKKGSSSKSSSSSSKPAADPNLPKTLTSSDIRAGVAPYKSAAKACGSKHGAPAGTKVKVKLSISGSTGTVTSASARPPHNGTPLGNCVAAAVKKSKFKKFQKSQLGAVYPFTM